MTHSARLALVMATSASLAVAVTGYLVLRTTAETVRSGVAGTQSETARHLMDRVDYVLYVAQRDVAAVAAQERVAGMLSASHVPDEAQAFIQDQSLLTGPWDLLLVVSPDGMVRAASDPGRAGRTLDPGSPDRAGLEAALLGQRFVSDLEQREGARPTVVFAAPVRRRAARGEGVGGAVVGHFAWPVVEQVLDTVPPPMRPRLLDREGRVIAVRAGDSARRLRERVPLPAELSADNSHVRLSEARDTLSVFHRQGGYLTYPGRGWTLLLELPLASFDAPLRDVAGRVALLVAALFSAAILLSYGAARRLSEPLKALAAVAARFGSGERGARAPERGGGEVVLLARSFNAILDRLAAGERDLRESEERFRQIAETVESVFFVADREGRTLYVSPAYARIWGEPAESLLSNATGWLDRVVEDDRPGVVTALAQQAERQELDYRIRRPDGELRFVHTRVFRVSDASGRVHRLIGIADDVTARRRSEEHVQLLAQGLQASREMISIADADGRLVFVNQAFLAGYGYTRSEVLGHRSETLLVSPRVDVETTAEIVAASVGQGWAGELLNVRKDGTEFPILLSTSPVHNASGRLVGILSVARDISEAKRSEAALLAARKQAESASRTKSEFLASMSHEIRTPMNGVIGMTGLLLDTELTPSQREYAETIRGSADSLLGIINDILDFSKIEAGRLEVEPVALDLANVVADVADILAPQTRKKGLELVVRYAPGTPRQLVGDAGRIRQVLMNLAGNAVKFTHRGHVLIEVEAAGSPQEGVATLRLSVEDTGIGIAEEQLGRVFDAFTQADGSTSRRYGGTGLGLSISRRLVALMGGELSVTSRLGTGSRFSFTLPLPLDRRAPVAAAPALSGLASTRALIVEDSATNRRVLEEQLASLRLRAEAVDSGPAGLERLAAAAAEGDPFRVALVDGRMHPMDGLAFGRVVKADPELSRTALLMLSSEETDSQAAAAAGFAALLLKPVRPSRLQDALATALTGRVLPGRTSAQPEQRRSPARLLRARVLVVEDNPVNQRVARLMLEKLGCRVDVAANGLEALTAVAGLPYDLVLMDCEMPEMDGYEATREIRRRESPERRLPIVAMTAHAMAGDRERCLAAGMDDYVSKPVREPELLAMIERWAGVKATAPAPPDATTPGAAAPPPSPLDPGVLETLHEAAPDEATFAEIVLLFLGTADEALATLRRAAAEGDASALAKAAHRLRGSCLNFGAQAMAETAAELEQLGRAASLQGAVDLVDGLDTELGQVRVALGTAPRRTRG